VILCKRGCGRPVDTTKKGSVYRDKLCRVCRKANQHKHRHELTDEEVEKLISEQLPTMPRRTGDTTQP
jgi:hypothetical protein